MRYFDGNEKIIGRRENFKMLKNKGTKKIRAKVRDKHMYGIHR